MANTDNTVKSNSDNDVILDIKVRYEDAINGIAKYKTQIDAVRKSNAEYRKELKDGTITEKEYHQAIAANNEITAQYNAKIKALRKEIQNNIKEETNRTGSIKKLEAEIARLVREYEVLGDTEKELARKSELSEKISNLQNQLNDENAAIGRFYGQVGNYQNAITNAIGFNNGFASSIFQIAKSSDTGSKSVSAFFTNASTSVKAFGKALYGLMANPVFLVLAGIVGAGMAFKFWFDYNKGIEEATRLTKQFTDLSGNELRSFRNEVQGVADTFGKDFKEVLEASNAVAKQFGITQQEALLYIKDGFIAGADANGEFLSTLKEYPAYFKEAGISADQFIAITAETANQGIFSDKGIDAIKEANIRLREMNTSTATALNGIGISSKQVQSDLQSGASTAFDVMQKISEKLNEYPEQSKQVGAAIADIFGGAGEDAGLQYLKTLKDIDTNLDEVKNKTGELGRIQEQQMNANIELQNVVTALLDQTGGTFETLIGNAKVFATESLTKIITGLIDTINWVIDLYNRSEMFRNMIQAIIGALKIAFNVTIGGLKLGFNLLRSIFELTKAIFTLEFGSIGGIMKDWANNFKDTVVELGGDIKKIVEDSVNNAASGNIKAIEIPVNTVSKTEGVDVKNGNKKAALTEEMKKAIESEKKAVLELAKFKLETEIKNQKDIADNQDKSENERLTALNNYFNLQRALIEKDRKFQLSELRKKYKTEEDFQKNEKNAIALIEEQSKQKQEDLKKELASKSLQIMQESETKQMNLLSTNIQNKLATIKKGSEEELALLLQKLELERQAEIAAAEKTGADKAAINAKYNALERQQRQEHIDYLNSQEQIEYQNQILQAELNNQNSLSLKLAAKQAEIEALRQLETESDAEYLNRKLILQGELKQIEDDLLDYQIDSQNAYMQAASRIAGGFQELFSSLAEDNEAFAEFAKAMALFQIGLDTATALTSGIAQAQSVPFPGNLVAIATTVATILANIAKAKKYLTSESQPKAPSFATGGYVSGSGSGTSDSISARLSNGESVLTARATSMFSPVLSAFNQIGGGIPISTQDSASQIMGEDMLSRAFAKAVQSLPNPVVSVEEINRVSNRVEMLENSRSL